MDLKVQRLFPKEKTATDKGHKIIYTYGQFFGGSGESFIESRFHSVYSFIGETADIYVFKKEDWTKKVYPERTNVIGPYLSES